MKDLLKKNLMIGLGLVSMTNTKIMELGKKLAEESKLSREEGEKFVEDVLKQAEDTKKNLEEQVSKIVEKTTAKMKLPCTSGFEKMTAELKSIQDTLSRLEAKIDACSDHSHKK